MTQTISPEELKQKNPEEFELIDVRTPAEFREVHVEYARNIPLDQLDPEAIRAEREGNSRPLYVICKSGNRARLACEKLALAGIDHLTNVEGGTDAAVQAGLPVVRGKKMMSLERQVRIAAGTLVVIGSLLGYFVSPLWMILPGFIGAGLVFAGITDTCGMGMMLAKMPWNQVRNGESCSV